MQNNGQAENLKSLSIPVLNLKNVISLMSALKPPDLIRAYFSQIIGGCDSLTCDCRWCRRCKGFAFHGQVNTPNDCAMKAISMALEHPTNPRLCPNLGELDLKPYKREGAEIFDENFKRLIRGETRGVDLNQLLFQLFSVIDDITIFPYLFRKNSLPITPNNISFDEDLLCEITPTMRRYEEAWSKYFGSLVNNFLDYCKKYNPKKETAVHIRGLLMMFAYHSIFESTSVDKLFIKILDHIYDDLSEWSREYFFKGMRDYPKLCNLAVILAHNMIYQFSLKDENPYNVIILKIARFIQSLQTHNSSSKNPFPSTFFVDDFLAQNMSIKIELELLAKDLPCFINVPAVIPLDMKIDIFKALCYIKCKSDETDLVLKVRRNRIIDDLYEQLERKTQEEMNRKLVIKFVGEPGIDVGGLIREFFQLSLPKMFSPTTGMWERIKDFTWFSRDTVIKPENYFEYEMCGRMISLAMYNGVICPIVFPRLLYKKLLHIKLTVYDLAELDSEIANSLINIMNMKEENQDVSVLYLDFTISTVFEGENKIVKLKEDGDTIDVTNDNVEEYLQLVVDYYLEKSIERQFNAFERGFVLIFSSTVMELFMPDELDVLVSGDKTYNWKDLEASTSYTGYDKNSKEIKWFWEVFHETLCEQQRMKFLLFVTSNDRVPVGGLKNLKIEIRKNGNVNNLPTSHTCFLQFDMPPYRSKKELLDKLVIALENNVGFGFE